VILTNLGTRPFVIKRGHRIAQLVVEKYFDGEGEEIFTFDRNTERGEQGFGSTGTENLE